MNYRKSRTLMWIGFVVGILIIAAGGGSYNYKFTLGFTIVGTIVFFAAWIQAFIFYRCPYCGYSLMNVRGSVPEHCPKCGEELMEE